MIDKEPDYGVATLHCRPCVGFCLSPLRGYAYRYHMHFYCFQLGFECSLFKKIHKVMIDKGTDEVLRGFVRSDKHHDIPSAVKYRQRNPSRSTLTVVAIVRHKRVSQRYADRMEEHPNILVKEAKTTRRLRRRLLQDLCIILQLYRANAIGHMLFRVCINCQTYY